MQPRASVFDEGAFRGRVGRAVGRAKDREGLGSLDELAEVICAQTGESYPGSSISKWSTTKERGKALPSAPSLWELCRLARLNPGWVTFGEQAAPEGEGWRPAGDRPVFLRAVESFTVMFDLAPHTLAARLQFDNVEALWVWLEQMDTVKPSKARESALARVAGALGIPVQELSERWERVRAHSLPASEESAGVATSPAATDPEETEDWVVIRSLETHGPKGERLAPKTTTDEEASQAPSKRRARRTG